MIAVVGPNLKASTAVIGATDRIVMPGLIDMHHRQYQVILRGLIADVTTAVDLSQISHLPAPSDACVAALKEAGRQDALRVLLWLRLRHPSTRRTSSP